MFLPFSLSTFSTIAVLARGRLTLTCPECHGLHSTSPSILGSIRILHVRFRWNGLCFRIKDRLFDWNLLGRFCRPLVILAHHLRLRLDHRRLSRRDLFFHPPFWIHLSLGCRSWRQEIRSILWFRRVRPRTYHSSETRCSSVFYSALFGLSPPGHLSSPPSLRPPPTLLSPSWSCSISLSSMESTTPASNSELSSGSFPRDSCCWPFSPTSFLVSLLPSLSYTPADVSLCS